MRPLLLLACLGLAGCAEPSAIKGWEAQIGTTDAGRAAQDAGLCRGELDFAAALAAQGRAARNAYDIREASLGSRPNDRQMIACMRRRGWYPIM